MNLKLTPIFPLITEKIVSSKNHEASAHNTKSTILHLHISPEDLLRVQVDRSIFKKKKKSDLLSIFLPHQIK